MVLKHNPHAVTHNPILLSFSVTKPGHRIDNLGRHIDSLGITLGDVEKMDPYTLQMGLGILTHHQGVDRARIITTVQMMGVDLPATHRGHRGEKIPNVVVKTRRIETSTVRDIRGTRVGLVQEMIGEDQRVQVRENGAKGATAPHMSVNIVICTGIVPRAQDARRVG